MSDWANTREGYPEGPIFVIRQLSKERNNDGVRFSFEYHTRETDLVRNETRCFVRVTEDTCYAEGNGRPVSCHTERYYAVTGDDTDGITAENWKGHVTRPPLYMGSRSREGVY